MTVAKPPVLLALCDRAVVLAAERGLDPDNDEHMRELSAELMSTMSEADVATIARYEVGRRVDALIDEDIANGVLTYDPVTDIITPTGKARTR